MAEAQLRLSFPEQQLLLPITEDIVDIVDLNADEFIVVHDHDAETDF
jgi:hypothetical protein